jgi:hypothetical protein
MLPYVNRDNKYVGKISSPKNFARYFENFAGYFEVLDRISYRGRKTATDLHNLYFSGCVRTAAFNKIVEKFKK